MKNNITQKREITLKFSDELKKYKGKTLFPKKIKLAKELLSKAQYPEPIKEIIFGEKLKN